MQVSWIDPEEVRALLAKLEGPRQAPPQPAWEIHTLPVPSAPAVPPSPEPGLLDAPPPARPPAEPAPPPDLPLTNDRPGPGNVWNIREQLRTLREQAQESGILPAGDKPEPPALRETTANPSPSVAAEPEPPPQPAVPLSDRGDSTSDAQVALETLIAASAVAPQPVAAPAPELSEAARSAMAQLLAPVGPQPEAPPVLDRATLPQPMSPPSTTTPMSIEFIGPAPGSGASEPLFGSLPSGEVIITPPPAPSTAPLSGPAQDEAPGASPRTPPPPEVADFVVPSAGLSERIDAVARWTCTRLGTEEVLLVDDFGDVLWGGREHTALVLSVMMAWHAAQRASAESATHDSERIDKELAHGRWLTALRVPTSYGTVRLAAICRESVRDEDARVIRAALVRAVEGSPPG